MSLLWQAKSLKDFTRLEIVRAAQAQDFGGGTFRAEVRYGDVVPGYSDSRSLWDVSQHLFHEGDESWFGLSVMLPADWIGWFPKNDELQNWPGNRDTLKGGQHGGSFFEWHHGPENGNWNDPMLGGSAPLYCVATDKDIKLYLVDPAVGPRPDALWTAVPGYERGRSYDLMIGTLWSADPKRGWVEAYRDGLPVVPRFATSTLYPPPRPPTFVYAQVGLYRRGFIGDPSLTWIADAKPGTTYPPLYVPKMGARVFPPSGGLPQGVQLKNLRLGNAKEDVMAAMPTDPGKLDTGSEEPALTPTPAAPASATPAPSTTPPAPEWLVAIRRDLISQLATDNDCVARATARRDATAKTLELLSMHLDSGANWLGP